MEKTKKAPRLRFPGFTDDWEQRKLDSLCDVFTDGDWIESKDQSESGIRLVQTGNVGTTEYLDKENNKKWISEETFEKLHCEEIFPGDILISRLPEPAGRACIIPDLGTRMITAVDCTIVRTKPEYESEYLVQYLSTPMYFKAVNLFLGGGTRQRISRGNLSGIDVPMPPTFEEQEKVGGFLTNLDNLIALHQCKLDTIKQYKQGMLQKMFPKEGKTVPEIRFPGFTGDWEQRKLGDYVTIVSGDAPSKFDEGSELYVKVDDLNYNPKYIIDSQSKVAIHKSIKKAPRGSVVFPKRGAAIMTNKVRILAEDSYMDTNMMALSSDKIDSEFLYNFISKEGLYKIADTSTIPQINNKHIEPYVVLLPELDEQIKIGEFFAGVDNLITLHQRKLDQIKRYKQGLLQKMFI